MTKRLPHPDEFFQRSPCPEWCDLWIRDEGPKRWRFVYPEASSEHEQPRLTLRRGIRRYTLEFQPPADGWARRRGYALAGRPR